MKKLINCLKNIWFVLKFTNNLTDFNDNIILYKLEIFKRVGS